MKMHSCCIMLLAMAAYPASAREIDPALERMANARVANGAIPGLVIATIVGKQQWVAGFGVVSASSARTPDADTVYEIGSITKTFTALLLADAVARGDLTLDQPVARLLPGYVIPTYRGQSITLLDLATQSSGLPRLPENLLPAQPDNPYADYTDANLKDFLAGYHLPRAPGDRYEYSNLGFGLLGLALSTRSGRSYPELVAARITSPLGMRDTGVALTPRMRAQLAPGHDAGRRQVPNWDLPTLAGAGALRSTAHDMLAYLQAHMMVQAASAPLGRDEVQLARRPTTKPGSQIGLAWQVDTVRGRTVVWHNGMTGGYAAFIGFTADGERGVVVLANASIGVDDIGMAALLPAEPPTAKAEAAPLATGEITQYLGRYQLAPGFTMTISAGPDGLLAQASGQAPAPLFPRKADEFFYKVVDASLTFERDPVGTIRSLTLHQNGRHMSAPRLEGDAPVPKERTEASLPAAVMHQYVGRYSIAPGFMLVVTEEAGQLHAQATGQGRTRLYASGLDEFFYKVVDAQVSFQRHGGAVTSLILHQNGRDLPAPRIDQH